MKRSLQKMIEFLVEVPIPGQLPDVGVPTAFEITPETLDEVPRLAVSTIPRFSIVGKVHRLKCSITQPFIGDFTIVDCNVPIRTVELQLVRSETVVVEDKIHREATEIQNIQIG
jgi:hypothetical protein